MLDIGKLKRAKNFDRTRVRNILISPKMEKFKEPFLKIFGPFTVLDHNGSQYFETPEKTKFCTYATALGKCKSLGIRSEIILKEDHWQIKFNGRWHPICELFDYIPEGALHKAKAILDPASPLFLRWPIDNPKEPIVITDRDHAVMVEPIKNTKGDKP